MIQSTLTGNIEANAHIKLRAFGLDQWIDFSVGAYGVLHDRALLVRVAQQRTAEQYDFDPRSQTTVLIGDTPADVEAGLLGGARVMAVATGSYSAAQLRAAGADAVVSSLADAPEVQRHLNELIKQGPPGVRSGNPSDQPAGTAAQEELQAGIRWARSIATHFLDVPGLRERRWLHVQAVAAKAQAIAAALGPAGCRLIQAAWLHDIGYSPTLARTGFHPLDAADFLKSAGAEDALTSLVAHHTGAVYEADERGLRPDLLARHRDEANAIRDALWTCDLTTGPDGMPVALAERLQEITIRYGPDHLVTRAVLAARPELEAAIDRTRMRLRRTGGYPSL
jgi:HAD-hyrolase-like